MADNHRRIVSSFSLFSLSSDSDEASESEYMFNIWL